MANLAPNGVDDSKESSLRDYLNQLGDLYVSGATSSEIPEVLADQGGILALAAKDAQQIRQTKLLGFIDMQRSWADAQQSAELQWKAHARAIASLARRQNWTGRRAAQAYVNAFTTGGGPVQDPNTIRNMLNQSLGMTGSRTEWLGKLADNHAQAAEELDIMSDTLAGIYAGTVELFTGDHKKAMALGGMVHNLAQPFYAMQGEPDYKPEPPGGWSQGGMVPPTGAWVREPKAIEKAPAVAPKSHATEGGTPTPRERDVPPKLAPVKRPVEGFPLTSENPWIAVQPQYSKALDADPEHPWVTLPPWPGLRGVENRATEGRGISEAPPPPARNLGGKTSPPRKLSDAYARDFVSRPEIGGKIRDAESLKALRDIFRRTHGLSKSGNGLNYTESRAAAGELATIIRKAQDPSVVQIEVVPAGKVRSPDLKIGYDKGAGVQVVPTEQFSLTGASRGLKPRRGEVAQQKWAPDSRLGDAILSKGRDTPAHRSQIHGGGEIVGQVFFRDFNKGAFVGHADATMANISEKLKNMPHVHAIELSAIENRTDAATATLRSTIRYERSADGTYSRGR